VIPASRRLWAGDPGDRRNRRERGRGWV